jgi:hypothetical protein
MFKRLTTERFIERARLIHENKFDYSKVNYIHNSLKLTIICPEHGEFEQLPSSHLQGVDCKKCAAISRTATLKEFIEKANVVHSNKYIYDSVNYINNRIKVVITCPIHGYFEQTPNNHLRGTTCMKCSGKTVFNTKDFIEKAAQIHNNKYDYSQVTYLNGDDKINIICPIHGVFVQSPSGHLNKQGCPDCAKELSGWTRSKFKNICKNKERIAKLYLVELYNHDTKEKFYKIGITSNNIERRMRQIPYNFRQEIIYQHEDSDIIYDLENLLHRVLKEYKYKPLIKFKGHTECFQFSLEVMKKFKDYIG